MASLAVGQIVSGTVNKIQDYGAFITLEDGSTGLVHISEVSDRYTKSVADVLEVGQKVNVKILDLGDNGKKIKLSIKATIEKTERRNFNNHRRENRDNRQTETSNSFDDILSRFIRDSEEKQCMINKRNDNRR